MSSALSALVPRFKNSVAFSGVWTRPTSAAVGPCATGTPPDTVERQITPIHPANTDRIYESGHAIALLISMLAIDRLTR